jgi:hypothetical protein
MIRSRGRFRLSKIKEKNKIQSITSKKIRNILLESILRERAL